MKILFLDSAHPSLRKELEKNNFICEEDFISSKEDIKKNLANYDGIILRSRINIDKPFIDCFLLSRPGRMPFIARVGAGMEHIDVAYAESKGIKCLSSPEGNRNAVAEHALGMLLNLLNNISKANAEVKAGKWLREPNRGTELEGKTIAIYGYGNTGSAFANVLRGFDVNILAYDKYRAVLPPLGGGVGGGLQESTPEEIFVQTDILSLHLPLTEETKYLVNDSFLSKFKKNIYLINTSRGPIVKTDDLVKNLQSGKVLGACLDVIEYEETSFEAVKPGTLNLEPGTQNDWVFLSDSKNVILTPHIAGWSFESSKKMGRILAEKIIALKK
ncbi:MAG: hydroxyacid dehydrogenase [Bacteroidetes bacterium]|nr:MAG: hydroxyacid dehydrogenase [Bacteroidota bacterium]